MKKMVKVILAAAAVVALAVPAMAADKLIVKHTSGGDAFKVDDNGKITEYTADTATNTELEYARYERSSSATPVAGLGAKSSNLLKLGSSSVVAMEQALKWKSVAAGAESADYYIRTYSQGTLRDSFIVSAQPFFYRYLPAATYNAPQAAGSFVMKKGLATLSNGTGPRLAFKSDDSTGATEWVVGSISFPVDYTNQTSSLAFTVRNSSTDTFAAFEALRVTNDGKMGLGTTDPKSKIHAVGLPTYADNATAKTALGGAAAVGAFYTDGVGNVKVVY